jgi:hypothetical protein
LELFRLDDYGEFLPKRARLRVRNRLNYRITQAVRFVALVRVELVLLSREYVRQLQVEHLLLVSIAALAELFLLPFVVPFLESIWRCSSASFL